MKQATLPSGSYLMIEVPEDAKRFWLNLNDVCYSTGTGHGEAYNHGAIFTEKQMMESLEVTHEILGKGDELKESDWERIVEYYTSDAGDQITHWTEFKNYNGKTWFDNPIESGHSWIKSHGMHPERIIILKIK